MRGSFKLIGCCIVASCAYLACLIALAPASALDAAVARASAGRIRVAEATGSLWAGTGQLEARDATGDKGAGTNFSWQFDPQPLIRGRLGFQVRFAGAARSFALAISPSGLGVVDAIFSVPASVLGLASPAVALIGPSGELHFSVPRLSMDGRNTAGEAIVAWRSAGSMLTPVSPLGDYELRVEGGPAGWNADLRSIRGPLLLSGKGSSRNDGPFAFTLNGRVEPHMQSQLVPLLRLIAIEREPGNFEFQLKALTRP